MLLNELIDGMEVDQVLLVRESERRQRRDGGDYLRLQLGDRTGAVACMVWEELGEVEELACAGAAVRVRGRYTVHPRFGPQINLRGLEEADPASYSPEDLLDGPARSVEQMESEVQRTEVTLNAVLDERMLPLGDVAKFHVGQVLELDATPRTLARLESNNEVLFWCQIGQLDGYYAVQVADRVDQKREFVDDILSR